MAIKGISIYAGVVDADYHGNITALLHNSSATAVHISRGQKVAQLIFKPYLSPHLTEATALDTTDRGSGGFGSTDTKVPIHTPAIRNLTPAQMPEHQPQDVQPDSTTPELPYNIILSPDPFVDVIPILIKDFGSHATMGMILRQCPYRNLPTLTDILPSQPMSRLKNWRSTVKHGYVTQIEEHEILTVADVIRAIRMCRDNGLAHIHIEFALEQRAPGIHPTEGIPMMYSDQLNVVNQQIKEIMEEHQASMDLGFTHTATEAPEAQPCDIPDTQTTEPPGIAVVRSMLASPYPPIVRMLLDPEFDTDSEDTSQRSSTPPVEVKPGTTTPAFIPANDDLMPQKFMAKQIRQSPDYAEWRKSQFQQLDMYEEQNMFGPPEPRKPNMNVWKLLWTYVQKPPPDGRKKARCVVDGSKRGRKNATVGHTFTNALAQNGERVFWALSAKLGLVVTGADVSNAFAEAPAPEEPLYILTDDVFHDWWVNHKGRPPFPTGWVCKVNYALQGHPEAPRLWEKHIHKIIKNIEFKATHHEPCLYSITYKQEYILFLRQVDDFAIATTIASTANEIINLIDGFLRIQIKSLGILQMFNGIDVVQSRYYIKLHCGTYLYKTLKNLDWLITNGAPHKTSPVPFSGDHNFTKSLDTTPSPQTEKEQLALSKEMGIHYRQVLGLFMWPMIKVRPYYSFHITKLSQGMANPNKPQYQAIRTVGDYLAHTINGGLYFWRDKPREDLPFLHLPELHPDNHIFTTDPTTLTHDLHRYADSDWAACRQTRQAITGGTMMLGGAAVGYKTKFQRNIAHSTSDAEWVSACNLGKQSLYFRSILNDLGMPQHHATVLYEDNRGALFMANAQQTSARTRHIDIREFALVDWVQQDLMIPEAIKTADNCSDALTKALAKQLFYRHNDTIMGRRIPEHLVPFIEAELNQSTSLPPIIRYMISRCLEPKITGG